MQRQLEENIEFVFDLFCLVEEVELLLLFFGEQGRDDLLELGWTGL